MAAERTVRARPGERDTTAQAVDSLARLGPGRKVLRLDELFGHRPEVLRSVADARRRGVSSGRIAEVLAREGVPVSESAIEKWWRANR